MAKLKQHVNWDVLIAHRMRLYYKLWDKSYMNVCARTSANARVRTRWTNNIRALFIYDQNQSLSTCVCKYISKYNRTASNEQARQYAIYIQVVIKPHGTGIKLSVLTLMSARRVRRIYLCFTNKPAGKHTHIYTQFPQIFSLYSSNYLFII